MSFLSVPISIFPQQPQRKIGDIDLRVVISETATDTLTITKQPVQQGASITDHAFKEPTTLTMSALFAHNLTSPLSKIYQSLLDLQSSRVPIDVITPKRVYYNMLIGTLSQTTDRATENCLSINFSLQEVILVKTSTTQVPRSKQANAGKTGKTENAGRKSALLVLKEGIGKAFGQ